MENPDTMPAKCNIGKRLGKQERYHVHGTPTIIFYLDGQDKGRMIGGFHFILGQHQQETEAICMMADCKRINPA
jgi:hypothetical protein